MKLPRRDARGRFLPGPPKRKTAPGEDKGRTDWSAPHLARLSPDERAEALLAEHLTDEQLRDWRKTRQFNFRDNRHHLCRLDVTNYAVMVADHHYSAESIYEHASGPEGPPFYVTNHGYFCVMMGGRQGERFPVADGALAVLLKLQSKGGYEAMSRDACRGARLVTKDVFNDYGGKI